jgi:signal transduction histidine kinase
VLARLTSLRLRLLVAMLASGAVGLGVATLLFRGVEHAHERRADAAKAKREARAIAAQLAAGAGMGRLAALQAVLIDDRITVIRDGRTVFRGPPRRGRELELRERARFPGGVVQIADYSAGDSATLELTLIAGGALVLVIAVAVGTATLVTRAVRRPVQRAIDVADRLAAGDFSARMGGQGPEELVKLGRAFDQMAARLERADRDQRRFLADVAHEIATPVNTVAGFALALADGVAQRPEEREEARTLVESETRRLAELLSDLRELTRLDLAERSSPAQFSLAPFAERLAARFRRAAAEAGVELAVSVHPAEVLTDERLLEMVASNLLSNAIRYTPAGGRVELRLRRRRDKLLLAVRDTGIGIAQEHHERIFERLYRVDSDRSRATGGSGLGLAIAARAARNLGGRIELSSAPGQGSEFRLVAPAWRGSADAPRATAAQAVTPHAPGSDGDDSSRSAA